MVSKMEFWKKIKASNIKQWKKLDDEDTVFI
jgi:hypothetical protein